MAGWAHRQWLWLLFGVPALAVAGLGSWVAVSHSTHKSTTRVLGEKFTTDTNNNGNGNNGNGGGQDHKDFTMSASVTGLYPGAVEPLPVLVTNPNNFAIAVTINPITISDANDSCTSANIRVAAPSEPVTVPGNGSTTVTLTVRMRNSSPNACKNATFALTYSGTAVKA